MSRRGFALLAVLWTLSAVTAFVGAALAGIRVGALTTRNRVLLARAAWAREACAEILEARYVADPAIRDLDSLDLGRGTWCAAMLEDPSAKLNVNLVDREALVTIVGSVIRRPAAVDSLVDALLDWRDPDTIPRPFGEESTRNRNGPLADIGELRSVRGFTDSLVSQLAALFTTRGTGVVNVNAAPPLVLAALPGMTEEAVQLVLTHRRGTPIPGADALASLLSPGARALFMENYPDFVRAAVFAPSQLMVVVTGGVRGTRLVARVTLTAVPAAGRLAVIRRETE